MSDHFVAPWNLENYLIKTQGNLNTVHLNRLIDERLETAGTNVIPTETNRSTSTSTLQALGQRFFVHFPLPSSHKQVLQLFLYCSP